MRLTNDLKNTRAYNDMLSLPHFQQFESHLSLIYIDLNDVEHSDVVRKRRVMVKCMGHRDNALRLVQMVSSRRLRS